MQTSDRARLTVFSFALLFFLLSCPSSRTQTVPTPTEYRANDVVVLSLEAMNPRAELQRHVREGLTSDSLATKGVEQRLLGIQMNIVRETAKFGPVLLLAPDEATKSAVNERCREFQICELLRSDRLRVKVVAHDGVWIRDFGPQIEVAGDSANVVHWRYFDIRAEEAKREKFEELETARLRLLEAKQEQDQPNVLTQDSPPEARKAVGSTIDDKLYLLREYSEILKEASPQRTNDENSAYDIADAVLANPDFGYKNSEVALDGGNLFRLEDGQCLTTRVLLSRNKELSLKVDEDLEKVGGCKRVIYLDALPGGVIEHIDMFALPVGSKRILLASYDLDSPFAAEYWAQLSDAERDLALRAELAMQRNTERLRNLGFDVVPVPSPFPRIPANGHTYYPSVLNALVRTGTDGAREVLVPSYKGYETDVQTAALKKIQEAFGPKSEIVTIEATEAAKSQGAIHCLTLTAPLRFSLFGDSADAARRIQATARKEQLDRDAAAKIEAQIPSTGLQGTWAILGEKEWSDESLLELYPQRIFFGKSEFQRGVLYQVESEGKYTIDKKDASSWSLHFVLANQEIAPAVVQWISPNEVRLILEKGSTLVLRRISSEPVSPFKRAEQGRTHGQ